MRTGENHEPNQRNFVGSTYSNTESAAEQITEALHNRTGMGIDLANVKDDGCNAMQDYQHILIGCSTWYIGEVQDDWHGKHEDLKKLIWNGKPVGLFGSGDQMTYSDTFQDALGILSEDLEQGGAKLVGFTLAAGYKHDKSRGQRGDKFVSLALDDDNEAKLTEPRVRLWVAQLAQELGILQKELTA